MRAFDWGRRQGGTSSAPSSRHSPRLTEADGGVVWHTPPAYARRRGLEVPHETLTEFGAVHGIAGTLVALSALSLQGHADAGGLACAGLRAAWTHEYPGENRFGRVEFGPHGSHGTREFEDRRWCVADPGVLRGLWVSARPRATRRRPPARFSVSAKTRLGTPPAPSLDPPCASILLRRQRRCPDLSAHAHRDRRTRLSRRSREAPPSVRRERQGPRDRELRLRARGHPPRAPCRACGRGPDLGLRPRHHSAAQGLGRLRERLTFAAPGRRPPCPTSSCRPRLLGSPPCGEITTGRW